MQLKIEQPKKRGPKATRTPTSTRMMNIIRDIATYKWRTIEDIYERFYVNTQEGDKTTSRSRRTAERDIQYLESVDLISVGLWNPPVAFKKTKSEPSIKIIHFNEYNLKKYEPYLRDEHLADFYDTLSDLVDRDNSDNGTFASATILHELYAARLLTRYVDGIAHAPHLELLFFENVSRSYTARRQYKKSEHNISIRGKKLDEGIALQPDGLVAVRDTRTNRIHFLMLEFDNNTEGNRAFEKKAFTYVWFMAVGDHKKMLKDYASYHGHELSKKDLDAAEYRVAITSVHEDRRNKLLDICGNVPKSHRDNFIFNSFPIDTRDIYGEHFIHLADFRAVWEQARDLPTGTTKHRRRIFIEEQIAQLPRVSCASE